MLLFTSNFQKMIPREGPPFPGFLPLVLRPKLPFYSLGQEVVEREWGKRGEIRKEEGEGEKRRKDKRGWGVVRL